MLHVNYGLFRDIAVVCLTLIFLFADVAPAFPVCILPLVSFDIHLILILQQLLISILESNFENSYVKFEQIRLAYSVISKIA